ncbi:inosine/xanthosine triphosphatase [Alteromonas halophila]|uniref:inosine/xanthosine triphosphatase n=1 Tax=Alteromonas halophila TaxID=516698 RepID=A0A918MZ52_9ALTE|nr:inosine/xanthosine triphosphatase [Alteromonas halophila]GGW90790.1 non-canonical purine NTP phosphatase [Alteromonas halophila]
MSQLIVGSTNPVKVNAIAVVLCDMLESEFEVIAASVPSGVPDQPMNEETTREGAINRVKACLKEFEDESPTAWYAAIEGGVDVLDDGPATFAYVALYHQGRWSVTRSTSLPLPAQVYQALEAGEELGDVMDRLFATENVKQKGGAIGLFTHHYVTRQDVYELAVSLAMAPFHFPDLYTG